MSGNASYIIENGHYALHSGDILMISPQNLHQLDINDSRETYERVVLWLNPKYVKTLSSAASDLSECFALCDERKDFLLRDAEVSATVKDLLFSLYSKAIPKNSEATSNAKTSYATYCLSFRVICANLRVRLRLTACKTGWRRRPSQRYYVTSTNISATTLL